MCKCTKILYHSYQEIYFDAGVYLYEYTNHWENGMRHHSAKKEFYNSLNITGRCYMEDITDAEYKHAKRNCKDFEIKKLRCIS